MEKIHASKLLAGLVPAGFLTSDPEVELVTTDKYSSVEEAMNQLADTMTQMVSDLDVG